MAIPSFMTILVGLGFDSSVELSNLGVQLKNMILRVINKNDSFFMFTDFDAIITIMGLRWLQNVIVELNSWSDLKCEG